MSWKGVKQGLTFCFPPLSSIHRGRHHPFSHQCPLPPRGCTITLQNQEGPPSQEQPLTKTPEATVRWIPVSHLGHQDLTQAHSRKSAICTVNRPHSQDRTTAPDLPPSSRYKPGDAARRQGRGDLTSSPQGCARGFGQKAPGAFLLVTKPSPLHSLVPVFCSTWRCYTPAGLRLMLPSLLCPARFAPLKPKEISSQARPVLPSPSAQAWPLWWQHVWARLPSLGHTCQLLCLTYATLAFLVNIWLPEKIPELERLMPFWPSTL